MMKKSIYLVAVSALLSLTSAIAAPQQTTATAEQEQQTAPVQTVKPNEMRQADPQRQVKRLTKRLQLTPEQQRQLLPILSQRTEQVNAIRNDASLSVQDRRAKLRDARQESETQIKNVLTDTQRQQYDAMIQQNRSHIKRHRAGNGTAS
jgi:periplasmic protein CpxP/Spy